MPNVDAEVREHVYEVLEGGSVEDFEAWFVGRTWDDRTPLAADIDHLLAERSSLADDELLTELRALVRTIHASGSSVRTRTASGVTTRHERFPRGGNVTLTRNLEFAGTAPAEKP